MEPAEFAFSSGFRVPEVIPSRKNAITQLFRLMTHINTDSYNISELLTKYWFEWNYCQ